MRQGEGNAFMDDSYTPSTIATVLGRSSTGSWVPGSQRSSSMAVGLNEINGCL
jgi:hypothetical protein